MLISFQQFSENKKEILEFSHNSEPILAQSVKSAKFAQLVQCTHLAQFDKFIKVKFCSNISVCSNQTII